MQAVSTLSSARGKEAFVLLHHPEDAQPAGGVTFSERDAAEAARIGLAAFGGKNLQVAKVISVLAKFVGWARSRAKGEDGGDGAGVAVDDGGSEQDFPLNSAGP